MLALFLLFFSSLAHSFILRIGPERPSRTDGIWPNNVVLDGSADPIPFVNKTISEDSIICDKLRIPSTHPVASSGLAVFAVGVYLRSAGASIRIALYTHNVSGRPGILLEEQAFTSVAGANEIELDQRWAFPVEPGGVSAAWVCVIHGRDSQNIDFYLAPSTDSRSGPYVSWNFVNANLPPQLHSYPSSAALPALGENINVWITGANIAVTPTLTPIPTHTATPTSTRTSTVTPSQPHTRTYTPTTTESDSRTSSETDTQTVSAIQTSSPGHYVYQGIPAVFPLVTTPWLDFTPTSARVGELVQVRLFGFHSFSSQQVLVKLGRGVGYDDCFGNAPGSSVQTLVQNRVWFKSTKADTYAVCIKYRKDWQIVERRFTVLPASPQVPFFGYSSCGELISANQTLCGCFFGASGLHVKVPITYPLRILDTTERLERVVDAGCCVDLSLTRLPAGTNWGYCTNTASPSGPNIWR